LRGITNGNRLKRFPSKEGATQKQFPSKEGATQKRFPSKEGATQKQFPSKEGATQKKFPSVGGVPRKRRGGFMFKVTTIRQSSIVIKSTKPPQRQFVTRHSSITCNRQA
jgi:hypothetical protein